MKGEDGETTKIASKSFADDTAQYREQRRE
jgi:hypothetical protein